MPNQPVESNAATELFARTTQKAIARQLAVVEPATAARPTARVPASESLAFDVRLALRHHEHDHDRAQTAHIARED